MSVYTEQILQPMLLKQSPPFDSDDYIFELKFDGFRCIAYLNESTVLKSRNNKNLTNCFFELQNLHRYVLKPCVLDGEIVILINGRPDFNELQKCNRVKNVNFAPKNFATFIAFDILYLGENSLGGLSLLERKKILQGNIEENNFLAYSRYIENNGKDLFKLAKQLQFEGIVAKLKNSKYHFGKRSGEWIKIKVYNEKDLLICGLFQNKNGYNLILTEFKDKVLVDAGTASVVQSNADLKTILDFADKNKIKNPYFNNYKGAVWFKPKLTGVVKFSEITKGGNMRHPIFKALK